MSYTVKQVAALSGISIRTLHHYHEIGLLKPAYTGANGLPLLRGGAAAIATANPVF